MAQIIFQIIIFIIGFIGFGIGLYLIFCPDGLMIPIFKKLLGIESPSNIGDDGKPKLIKDFTYDEFTVYIYSNNIDPVREYDDFDIYYIDGHYYYFYTAFDKDEFYEVEEVALLEYSCVDDILFDGVILSTLFECDVCGEQITDDRIYYGWYKKVGGC